MPTGVRTALKTLSMLISLGLIMLMAALVGVRLFGLKPFRVLSGSMEPVYPEGSLIYIRKTDYRELKVGDAITYRLDKDTVVTHRITEILVNDADPHTVRYFTKGDANACRDSDSVHRRDVLGRPVFCIPALGRAAGFIQSGRGALFLLMLFALALPGFLITDGKRRKRTKFKLSLHNGACCYNINTSPNNKSCQEVEQ